MLNKLNHWISGLLLDSNYKPYRHLLIQLVVVLITINIFWDEPTHFQLDRTGLWFAYFLLMNAIIYINIYLLVPHLLLKGKTWRYMLSFPLLMGIVILVLGLLQNEMPDNNTQHSPELLSILSSIASFGLLLAGITTFQLFVYRIHNIRKIQELESVTMEIELANLQSQINPHFLFNMLNSANILADEDAEKSSFILSKLNELLHYQIDGSNCDSVLLQDDISFLVDYLELEKTRRDRFNYSIQQKGNANIHVPPLLFIPFVENGIKHNPENDSYIHLIFDTLDDRLYFECENPKPTLRHPKKEGGLGLVNIKKRLNLLFDKNYTLQLKDEADKYTVKLILNIPTEIKNNKTI